MTFDVSRTEGFVACEADPKFMQLRTVVVTTCERTAENMFRIEKRWNGCNASQIVGEGGGINFVTTRTHNQREILFTRAIRLWREFDVEMRLKNIMRISCKGEIIISVIEISRP